MFNSGNINSLLKIMKEVYDESIVIKVRFESLLRASETSLAEYKRLNEKLIEKIESIDRDRIRSEAEMLAKISSIQARLDAFSEKAMRSAVSELADRYVRDMMQNSTVVYSNEKRQIAPDD